MALLLGIRGPISSGKDTVASIVKSYLSEDIVTLAFADPIKEFLHDVFSVPHEHLWGPSYLREIPFLKNAIDWDAWKRSMVSYAPNWASNVLLGASSNERDRLLLALGEWFHQTRAEIGNTGVLTPRRLLQTLGTECGRAVVPDMWCDYGIHRALRMRHNHKAILFTDVRFPNESAAISQNGGQIWYINRPGLPLEKSQHSSESFTLDADMRKLDTYTIDNDGTLDDLDKKITSLCALTFVH